MKDNKRMFWDYVQNPKLIDKEIFFMMYLTLYKKIKDLQHNQPDNWIKGYNTYIKKIEQLEDIIMYMTDMVKNFEMYTSSDINKIIILICSYQTKFKGLKKLVLTKEV